MRQLFVNSGIFTSLDAITHWANKIAFEDGVIRIEHSELVRFVINNEPHYRMQLRLLVMPHYAKSYLLRVIMV